MILLFYFPHCQNYGFVGCLQRQTTCPQTEKQADGGIVAVDGKEDTALAAADAVFVEVVAVAVVVI